MPLCRGTSAAPPNLQVPIDNFPAHTALGHRKSLDTKHLGIREALQSL